MSKNILFNTTGKKNNVFSFRFSDDEVLHFLKSLENRNKFVLELIKNSSEYQVFLKNKLAEENEPRLFNLEF